MAIPVCHLPKRIIILEGPDGGGKTTLGKEIADRLSVIVDNHGPYLGQPVIWKNYFDTMLPAYAGERDVILDRCWLAEPVYGRVMRGGLNRLQNWQRQILEHVAAQCRTTVVYCLPGVESCVAAFNSRRAQEYPEREQQIRDIYELYLDQAMAPCRFGRTFIYNWRDRSPNVSAVDALAEQGAI